MCFFWQEALRTLDNVSVAALPLYALIDRARLLEEAQRYPAAIEIWSHCMAAHPSAVEAPIALLRLSCHRPMLVESINVVKHYQAVSDESRAMLMSTSDGDDDELIEGCVCRVVAVFSA